MKAHTRLLKLNERTEPFVHSDASNSSSSSESDDDEVKKTLKRLKERGKSKKKPGPKSSWLPDETADVVDVVCSSEYFRKKIIFTNVKTVQNTEVYQKIVEEVKKRCTERNSIYGKSVKQTRTKMKSLIRMCKKEALARITATGIANMAEKHGAWFRQLFPYVQSRESADPDQGREPSYEPVAPELAGSASAAERGEGSSSSTSTSAASTPASSASFTPVRRPTNKKPKKDEILIDAIKAFQAIATKDPTKELTEFMSKENENARNHEKEMLQLQQAHQREMIQMMLGNHSLQRQQTQQQPQQQQHHSQQFRGNLTWPSSYYQQ